MLKRLGVEIAENYNSPPSSYPAGCWIVKTLDLFCWMFRFYVAFLVQDVSNRLCRKIILARQSVRVYC
jgi:hypothetical protein